ncbi:MAG: tetratricopeptide repeat protein [Patescibacteria group bacterium]
MEAENITSPAPKPAHKLIYWAFSLLTFILSFFVTFGVSGSAYADKLILFSTIVLVSFFAFVISRLREGIIILPRSIAFYISVLLLLVYLVASIFSLNSSASFVGTIFDTETFWVILFLVMSIYLVSMAFNSLGRLAMLFISLFASSLILFITQVVSMMFGSGSNLFGSWYDLGIFFGLTTSLALASWQFAPRVTFFKWASIVTFLISGVALIFTNFILAWILVAIFALSLGIVSLTMGNKSVPILPCITFVLALAFIIFGGQGRLLGNLVDRVTPAPLDVRPSWQGTAEVAIQSLKDNPLLGVGPNLFQRQWVKYKPASVNQSPYFATDFNHGVGYIPSSLITVGLIGFLAWLALIISLVFENFANLKKVKSLVEPNSVYIISTAVGSMYLWVISILYVPSLPIIIFTAILSGATIACGILVGRTSTTIIPYISFPKSKLLIQTLFVILAIGAISVFYLFFQKYRAWAYSSRGDVQKALTIDNSDTYQRLVSERYMTDLEAIVADTSEDDKAKLQEEFSNQFNFAVEAAKKATELDGTNYNNWIMLGRVYQAALSVGVSDASSYATDSYAKAIELNPTSPALRLELARVYLQMDDRENALKYLSEALALRSNYLEASPTLFQLGYLEYKEGNYTQARLYLEQAIIINPDYANAKYFLALTYYELGDPNQAGVLFENILSTNPNNKDIMDAIANLKAGLPPIAQ